MGSELIVGARGWEHPSWAGAFYPEDLPAEWRLGYYSNAFRGVLVPVETFRREPEPGRWADEVPEGFWFFVELTASALAADAASCERGLEALRPWLGGVSLDLRDAPEPDPARAAGWVARIGALAPVCLRRAVMDESVPVCWEQDVAEGAGGIIGLVPNPPEDAPGMRAVIERFLVGASGHERVLLCLPGGQGDWRRLQQARIIGEILGA